MKNILFVITLCVASLNSHAGEACDQATIEYSAAVEVYKKDGSAAFLNRAMKGGPLESDKEAMSMSKVLEQIEQFYGSIESSSILSTKDLGDKSCYILSVLEYENGPAYAVANYYIGTRGISATSMIFHTKPEKILPQQFLIQ